MRTHPFQRIQIQLLNLSMTKETRQAHTVVSDMWFFPNDNNLVLSLGIELD